MQTRCLSLIPHPAGRRSNKDTGSVTRRTNKMIFSHSAGYGSGRQGKGRRVLACLTAALVTVSMTAAAATPVFAAGKTTKEETVYVITDSTGAQNDVIVSDHLSNKNSTDTISDETTLKDIENVKGKEKFKKGSGDKITWQAKGNDIYYQGKTDKEAPVDMSIKYYLDGKQTTGEKLQGKSGDVKIEIKYDNKQSASGGVRVPFIVMTGFLVEDDCMKNVTISSGKVIDDGEKMIVVGMAAPGLADSLDISEDKLGISDTVTITGEAKDFSLEDMMTIVTSDIFQDVDTSEFDSLDLDEQVKELDSGAKKLVSGSTELYDGIHMLNSKTGTLKSGVSKLDKGASRLDKGAASALSGSKTLASSSQKFSSILESKLGSMREGAEKLYAGSQSINTGVQSIAAGINGTSKQTGLADGSAAVSSGIQKIAAGVNGNGTEDNPGLVTGSAAVAAGIDELASTLSGVAQSITASVTSLEKAKAALKSIEGADETQQKQIDAAITAIENSEKIQQAMGSSMSTEKVSKLQAGSKKVSDGAKQIAAGVNGDGTAENPGLVKGSASVAGGISAIKAGLDGDGTEKNPGMIKGAAGLEAGAGELAAGLGLATAKGTKDDPSLTSGAKDLADGASTLAAGQQTISSGASELAAGMSRLNASSVQLISGVKKLDAGALQLQKGMKQLYNEGISKIVDMYNNDLKGVTGNLDSIIKAGKDYKTFTELPDGMDGSVKFIYKTKVSGE